MTDLVQRLRAASRLFHPIQHDAADALEAKDKEIAKYKAICDQMGAEMKAAIPSLEIHFDSYFEALAAWREMK